VLTAIALTPSAPVLVPELAGAAATEVAGLRDAALAAAATLPDRWIVIGISPAVGSTEQVVDAGSRGSFAGYGADVAVTLSPDPVADVSALPLCALFAGWLRGRVRPQARVDVRVYPADCAVQQALAHGRALRAEIDAAAEPIGVLIVADGANTLNQSAPGGYDPASQAVQDALDDALARGAAEALTALPDGIVGRAAYQVLAGLAPGPVRATEIIRGAPYGVGYFVGTWVPVPETVPTPQ
jgi:hypothetical protein